METPLQEAMTVPAAVSARTLIADDQPDVLEALSLLLKREGYQIQTAASPSAVLEALEAQDFDLLLMDLNYARDTTSGREGLDLLSRIHALDRALPVVVMTAWSSVELAVEAMHRGVADFVQKPWDNARLLSILREQIALGRAHRRSQRLDVPIAAIKEEFAHARDMQRGFLPREIPQLRGFTIAGLWRPALVVSGDYYDVLKFDEDRAALCIADVAGKGMPAALLMSNLQAAVRAYASASMQPCDLFARVNRIICDNIPAGRFISMFYGLLDASTRRLVYAGAGHNPPILLRRDGTRLRLPSAGRVLGVAPDWSCPQGEVILEPGDRLVLFTDGVTEARDERDAEFGEPRLIELLASSRHLPPAAIHERIAAALAKFCPGGTQDDVTLLTVAVRAEAAARSEER